MMKNIQDTLNQYVVNTFHHKYPIITLVNIVYMLCERRLKYSLPRTAKSIPQFSCLHS